MPAIATLALLAACSTGPDAYDIATWRSPLSSQFDGEGDPAEGERIYFEEHWTDTSEYNLSCSSCHAADPADTLTVDAGELQRPAHTTWNAALRTRWKGGQNWDSTDPDYLGGYGGQICVTAYWTDAAMTPEQAAHLEAWMKTNIDDAPASDDPRAQPLDYAFNTWDTQEAFVDGLRDGAGGWLAGSDLGDVSAGEGLAAAHCGSCHASSGAVSFYSVGLNAGDYVRRIRRTSVDDVAAPNDRMTRIPWDRLPDEDLRDLLAWLTR